MARPTASYNVRASNSIACSNPSESLNDGCPGSGSTDQYQATLEIPFTYGVPFTYTVSFDTSGGAGGGSFIYSAAAGLVRASTGNAQDIITDQPNPVPELPTWECLLVGIGAVGFVKRVIAGRAV